MPKIVDHNKRRREIIEACWSVFVDKGEEGLTIRNVAQAMNCATGRITHYFDSREQLVAAAIQASYDDVKTRTDAILGQNLSALEKLHRIGEELIPIDKRRLTEARVWLAFWSLAAADGDLAQENDARHEDWKRDLQPLLREINSDLDLDHEASSFVALINGLNIHVAVHPTAKNRKHARQTLQTHIDHLSRTPNLDN